MSVLIIPVDASKITDADRKQQRVKVAVQQRDVIKSQVISVEGGKAEVKFDVDPKQPVSVAVGPENASDEDIFHLQTLTSTVSPTQWPAGQNLTVPALAITPNWWIGWLNWCRTFVITGRVVCADGSPVPGAEVTAYDVDFFWWWSSIVQVGGTAITDASGHFAMKFRWCCGWWPWWWWNLRRWRLEYDLVDKIQPVLKLNPRLKFPAPDPVPSLDFTTLNPQPLPPAAAGPAGLALGKTIDPTVLPGLREKLMAVLPHVPELERLRIWPWFPWAPWFDCNPDIIFRVKQRCGTGPAKVIYSENVFQTRWNAPTNLNVTLVANKDACCVPPPPNQPEGDCALITGVCGDPGVPVTQIGGNLGAPAAPAGYANPGGRDRPFAESVSFNGLFGTTAQADYYEIEYTPHGAAAWATVPEGALQDLYRQYHDSTIPFPLNPWTDVVFSPTPFAVAGGYYESRHHYELTHPPANWNDVLTGRAWSINANLIASIQTAGFFPEGTYDFRILGYKALAGGGPDLATRKVLAGCGQNQNTNFLVLRIDNRVPPNPLNDPGSVHVATTEPDCGILSVNIGAGPAVQPCGAHPLKPPPPFTPLDITFFVSDDPDGHLDHYEFVVKFDLGTVKNLLNPADVGALTLTTTPGHQAGPDYSNALTQGAVRPTWRGGTMQLHIADASKVFPKTCCYVLELTVSKRNIVNCNGNLSYYNQMHTSFTVTVS